MAHRGRRNADDALLATLAGGSTVQAAARRCEVSERTIFRRLQDPAFRHRLTQARSEMIERALGHLAAGSAEAAIVLRNLLSADRDIVRLSAARSILELGGKLREHVELEERMRRLEQHVARSDNP